MGAGTYASETACAWRARVDVRVRARASACVDMLAVGCASLGLPLRSTRYVTVRVLGFFGYMCSFTFR